MRLTCHLCPPRLYPISRIQRYIIHRVPTPLNGRPCMTHMATITKYTRVMCLIVSELLSAHLASKLKSDTSSVVCVLELLFLGPYTTICHHLYHHLGANSSYSANIATLLIRSIRTQSKKGRKKRNQWK